MSSIIKSISITPEFDELAKKYRISWTEAARVGLSLILAELGEQPYNNQLQLFKKMTYFKTELEKLMSKQEECQSTNKEEGKNIKFVKN